MFKLYTEKETQTSKSKIRAGERERAEQVRVLAMQARGPEFKSPAPTVKSRTCLHMPITLPLRVGRQTDPKSSQAN